jgi:hypothetical protein
MKVKINKWSVAFRAKRGEFFNIPDDYLIVNDTRKGFCADPFLFDYNGDTYLFVEYFPYKLGRGVIAYTKYNPVKNCFGDFKEIIREKYHLSYPLVFEYKNEIYMMPEANESNSLYVYKAKRFPDRWEKHKILMDGIKLVDTTPFIYNDVFYAISKNNETPQAPMMLLKIDADSWKISDIKVITDDVSMSRPGGNVFTIDEKYYMVTQDCKDDYGKALNILSFTIDDEMNLSYKSIKKINPEDIEVKKIKQLSGIHTYNFNDKIEVVDFKYPEMGLYRLFWRFVWHFKKRK